MLCRPHNERMKLRLTIATIACVTLLTGCGDDGQDNAGPSVDETYELFVLEFDAFAETHCDCYTDEFYEGDRAMCEGMFAEQPPIDECQRDIFDQYPKASVEWIRCGTEASRTYHQCILNCPPEHDELTCANSLTNNWLQCQLNAPADMIDGLHACAQSRATQGGETEPGTAP